MWSKFASKTHATRELQCFSESLTQLLIPQAAWKTDLRITPANAYQRHPMMTRKGHAADGKSRSHAHVENEDIVSYPVIRT